MSLCTRVCMYTCIYVYVCLYMSLGSALDLLSPCVYTHICLCTWPDPFEKKISEVIWVCVRGIEAKMVEWE